MINRTNEDNYRSGNKNWRSHLIIMTSGSRCNNRFCDLIRIFTSIATANIFYHILCYFMLYFDSCES